MRRHFRTTFPKLVFIFFFVFRILAPILAQTAIPIQVLKAFPDFLPVRSEFLSALITSPTKSALQFKATVSDTSSGKVRISVEQSAAMFYVMFLRERNGTYPYSSRGNIIIKRESSTGHLKSLKWFLSDDGKSYLFLTPKNERTIIDYVVGGAVVRSGISVNTLFYYFITQDFSFIFNALKSSINWNLVFVPAVSPFGDPFFEELSVALSAFAAIPKNQLPRNKAGLLLRAIFDISTVNEYFASIGKPTAEIIELIALPFTAVMESSDIRDSGSFSKAPSWRLDGGFTISVIQPLLTLSTESVYFVFVDSSDGKPARKLLALVSPGSDAVRQTMFYDAESREILDFGQMSVTRPEANVRVFQLSAS